MATKKKRKKASTAKQREAPVPDEPVDSRLTRRELDALKAVARFMAKHKGKGPTRSQLSKEMGIKGSSGSQNHVEALREKGHLLTKEQVRLSIRGLTELGEKTLLAERELERLAGRLKPT